MPLPLTRSEFLKNIAVETARMSYPGSMSRGKRPVVSKGTKATLERFFRDEFPMNDVWGKAATIAADYDGWHRDLVNGIATCIEPHVSAHNVGQSVAAKFLNTFMHQLMKYESARPLFNCLHLPLDARVFSKLRRIRSPSLMPLRNTFAGSPYSLPYERHEIVQDALWPFLDDLNSRRGAGFQLTSRIDLNWLWL